MSEPRVRILPGTGGVEFDTRFSQKARTTLTGNVTLTLVGMDEGDIVSLWLTQDGTGTRTLTITAAAGGANVVLGPSTAIASTAGDSSKVVIVRVGGIYYVEIIAEGAI